MANHSLNIHVYAVCGSSGAYQVVRRNWVEASVGCNGRIGFVEGDAVDTAPAGNDVGPAICKSDMRRLLLKTTTTWTWT